MRKFFKEFKEFTLQGNVMNLAVGVIIGAAFKAIVDSLTGDILSPVIGLFTKKNLDSLVVHFFDAELRYGAFITSIINFIIMAFVVFWIVKAFNAVNAISSKKNEPAAATTKTCPYCKSTIAIDATRCPNCTSAIDS